MSKHTLLFLDPGHFHATLTLRTPQPRAADEIVVYAPDGPELRDFLALVDRFNTRADNPTRWRPLVIPGDDPFDRLVAERRGDVVVLAGRNGGKARTMRRLHDAGFHVLADKPWLVSPSDLDEIASSLAGWPLATEMMTGRYDVAARLHKRLVDTPDVFGRFRSDGPAIELDGVHQLAKLVDGAPLRRPWWFFDVRVQGRGAVDIPTHLVDQTQWLLESVELPQLVSARAWSTRVPLKAFHQITGHDTFPYELQPFVDGEALDYSCNAELTYRIGTITARAATRWDLSATPGAADTSVVIARGTRSEIRREQGPQTGNRRRLFVDLGGVPLAERLERDRVARAVTETIAALQGEFPGVGVTPGVGIAAARGIDAGTSAMTGSTRYEVTIPAALDAGHESQFARVLDDFLQAIDEHRWPSAVAERTLAKYRLLADAAARTTRDHATAATREGHR